MIRSLHDHDRRCVSTDMFGDDRSICRLSPAASTQKLVEKFITKYVKSRRIVRKRNCSAVVPAFFVDPQLSKPAHRSDANGAHATSAADSCCDTCSSHLISIETASLIRSNSGRPLRLSRPRLWLPSSQTAISHK